jgi:Asp/Glu/hydantoin racemase
VRILVINPNTTESMTADIGESARRHALPTTEVDAFSAPWGPRSIESHVEEAPAAAAPLETVARHRDDYDAFVLACYGDPALYAARELEIDADLEASGAAILSAAKAAIAEDGAEAIALGCAGMGPLDTWLRKQLPGAPVIDGVAAAVKLCEALHGYGLTTSKVGAFQRPGPKELVGVAPSLQEAVGR